MIKYCYEKWNKNQNNLRQAIECNANEIKECDYHYLVKLVVDNILNDGTDYYGEWSTDKITVIDNGDYQGTLLFLIPRDTYQPSCDKYLMTYSYYGSCSGCDTLLNIQSEMPWEDGQLTKQNISDIMVLCKDLVMNMIKPYKGYSDDNNFEVVEIKN